MSTHDYVIDNQSAPAFRADLNNVLAAIASQNSSGTAPTVTFANMIWYDTSANQIKKRNEANSAWITLGTIDETAGTFTPSGSNQTAPTTAQVLTAMAGATAGSVGSTMMGYTASTVFFNGTIAGPSLQPSGATSYFKEAAVSGTWRCLGHAQTGFTGSDVTSWLRIA